MLAVAPRCCMARAGGQRARGRDLGADKDSGTVGWVSYRAAIEGSGRGLNGLRVDVGGGVWSQA